MSGIHIAALFETSAAAHAARDQLVAAGVDAARILVLDRGHPETEPQTGTPRRLWAVLKHVFVPDRDAHHYAEGIMRGHPLLVADVTEADRDRAVAVLQAAHPSNIEARAEQWRNEGWEGTFAGQRDWEEAVAEHGDAITSSGIVGGDLIAGDYGAVGGTHGLTMDTDILRGKRFTARGQEAVRVDDGEPVQVYEIKP